MKRKEEEPPTPALDILHAFTTKQVADRCGVHPNTVTDWIKDRKLKAIQFGSRDYRIIGPDLLEFLVSWPKAF